MPQLQTAASIAAAELPQVGDVAPVPLLWEAEGGALPPEGAAVPLATAAPLLLGSAAPLALGEGGDGVLAQQRSRLRVLLPVLQVLQVVLQMCAICSQHSDHHQS